MRERGFCLVEVLVAATIVIVALGGLAQLFVIASASNQRARLRTMATVLARSRMDELRASREVVAGGVDYRDARGDLVERAIGAAFIRRWSVAAMPSNPDLWVLEVTVSVPHAAPAEVVRMAGLKTSRMP
jgi:type II secretory pathway pseudopilin PulG